MEKGLDGLPGAHLRIILASAAMEQGDLDSATSQLEESLALCREAGDRRGASISLFVLGAIELQQGHLEGSTLLLEESARITRELGDTPGIAYCVWTFGKLSATRGQPVRAARLWGAAEALREQMGLTLSHFDLAQSGYERGLAAVRSALPEASFEAAWNEGRNMDLEQAIEYALSEDEPEPSIVSEPEEPSSPLSRREHEVALLISRGLTNRQIASELGISERTVTTHVGRILAKLGATSRTQIAAWVIG
jgi:DNA-binding CsgD family transcriptional regulator